MKIRLTRRVRRVINTIHNLDQAWGLAICQRSGLGPGTVYPILERLAWAGWISSRTEDAPPAGRSPRTFYYLTLRGQMGAGLNQPKEK